MRDLVEQLLRAEPGGAEGAQLDAGQVDAASAVMRRLLDPSPIALALLDRDLQVVHVSPALAALTGAVAGPHPSRHVADVLPGGAELAALVAQVRDTNAARFAVERLLTPELRVRIHCYPISAADRVVGIGCVFERATRDAFRDQLLAAVSHELRAPLATMMLWLKALREDSNLRPRAVEAIHESAVAQSRLIDDLLDISRAMTGKLQIGSRPVAVERELGAALDRIAGAAAVRGVTIEARIDPGLGDVLGDDHRLGQVFDNLLTNAVKFSEPGGRVDVSGCRVGPTIEIVVADSGRGISTERAARLFEPFDQGDDTPSRAHGSLGVGLAIARQLIELHGGTLAARSAGVGRGASFTVTLPVEARRRATPVLGPQPEPLDGVRVLVVDDSPDMLEALSVVLRAAGAVVECASSVEAAWPRLLAAVPDLVVSDVVMPHEDGLSLARRIRATDALREVAMVALTANASDLDTERALAAGFDVHVAKPVDFDELLIGLRTALRARLPTTQGP